MIKSGTGGTTVNIFSGSSVIAEYDNGALPSAPSREYIYNPAGGATTGLLAMISGGTTTYFHQDDKSVRLTTDANGNVLAQQGTYPFGESWYTNLGPNDNWVFTSYDRDSESGLDYALARYYDSRTGTFCSADPLAGSPDDPQSWNRYAYGRNDPIDITDPSGKSWWSWALDIGIGITLAVLPEVAPAIFGSVSAGAGGVYLPATTTAMAGGNLALTSTLVTWGDLATSGIAGGLAGAGVAAVTNQPKAPQTPTTPQTQMPKKECPPVPNHPQGVDVNANIKLTQDEYNADPTGNGAKASWFKRSFNGGIWDYKVQYHSWQQWDDIGNFNYGATGSVFGYSMSTLSVGAVFARMFTKSFWSIPVSRTILTRMR